MSETKEQIYAQLHEWIEVTGVFPRGCSYEGEAESFIDQAFAAGEASAAAFIATQAAQIEAIKKVRDQYASQARFSDIDCAVHFRDFVRRIDAAIAAVGAKHKVKKG